MEGVSEIITSTIGGILAGLILLFLLFLVICAIIYDNKCQQNQKQYIDLLSDEEKALILEYRENGKLPISVIFKKHNSDERSDS